MGNAADRALAIVGVSAILPDAPDASAFWRNLKESRYSISEIPPGRWDPAHYYDPDPSVPEKTYSKIGGWVRDWEWEPMKWRLPIPPKVADAMDESQKWAVACARSVLLDYGHPERPLDFRRTAVVVGTAMAGDLHYWTALPIFFPEFAAALAEAPAFAALPADVQETITREYHERVTDRLPAISEDSMPGELANCIAGRIANLFDFHGPNFICDAACASALAAIDAAHDGLLEGEYDAALVGGVDRNMGPSPFVKFSKIGALSATGTRPYGDGADGFVMGEGAAFFLLKRLEDAEAHGDRIYAVLRGVAGSSDGRGKGITAPNPAGQRIAVDRAWRDAGVSPATATLVEGHGTSTRVGDVVEVETLNSVFGEHGLPPASIALGSVKSNIGHLKGAAGAAGLLKVVLSLHEKVIPPSLNAEKPNPNIDFASSPFYVNTELKPWDAPEGGVRRAGLSAFGFGGTNYHAVLEEYVPGLIARERSASSEAEAVGHALAGAGVDLAPPPRGALVLGEDSADALRERLEEVLAEAKAGRAPAPAAPEEARLRAAERLAIDYGDAAELATKAERALKAFAAGDEGGQSSLWKALRSQGIFRGRGDAPKVAFLYTGQGSQYVNMLRGLRESEAEVAEIFDEADRVMTPLLGRPLSEVIFVDPEDSEAVDRASQELRRTEITQPAVLTVDAALTSMLGRYGVVPDMVMGHSLGEYGALVAAGALPFDHALEAVSARGRGMASLAIEDNGLMAAVFAPLDEIESVLAGIDGNVVVANVNSTSQAVIGGASAAVEEAIAVFQRMERNVVLLPVSHAFHTSIVAPASEPLRDALEQLSLSPPSTPLVANVTGELYPMGPDAVPQMLDLLAKQVASPVQFVKGLRTLFDEGVRVFVEVGPKKALHGFVNEVLGDEPGVMALFTNHPKLGDAVSLNHALCGLYASGLGVGRGEEARAGRLAASGAAQAAAQESSVAAAPRSAAGTVSAAFAPSGAPSETRYTELGRLFAEFMERGAHLMGGDIEAPRAAFGRVEAPVVTGASLGLPGRERIFDDLNVQSILDGEQEIDLIPTRFRHAMVDKHITRLVKSGGGGPHFESIDSSSEVIKLAARGGRLDLVEEFGVPAERVPALDWATRLAMAAGLEALRDAGIPLVMRYRTTSKGTKLPDRWALPDSLRDETGVIFASAFPGYESFAEELGEYFQDHGRVAQLDTLHSLRKRAKAAGNGTGVMLDEIERRIHELEQEQSEKAFAFDRRFLFRILSMGHSQFAEYIGARGPNTHVNSACASTTQAFSLAEDWIAAGRCRRVVIVAADDATSEHMLEWVGAGFLASGAAATDDVVEEAALPFDRRRHGMILGMGAAGAVVESPDCARERGVRPICEVLSTVTANSAFHGTRLDVEHIGDVMERVVAQAEQRFGIDREQVAGELMFMSHETYTPARGGSASAEVEALRRVFGLAANRIVVANTKGFTGHPMGVGIEDIVAIKALETGTVPPVPNYKEQDPDLGPLNLSQGGIYPIRYALRLGAGFGSQISMSLLRWSATPDGSRPAADALGYESRLVDRAAWQSWLQRVSGEASPEIEVAQRTLRVKDPLTSGWGEKAASSVAATAPSGTAKPAAAVAAAAPSVTAAPTPAAAPAASPAVATPAATPAAANVEEAVREQVLAIVAEKTGYPSDMLDPELDLEADLGIDTVKQAETFAAIREHWEIPRDENVQLRDYPTLEHAVRFVMERAEGLEAPAAAAPAAPVAVTPAAAPAAANVEDAVREQVLAIVAEKTGYPSDMLDPELDLEADLGIDTVKQAETFAAIREHWDIPRDENVQLRDYPTLEHAVRFVMERAEGLEAPAAAAPTAPAATPAAAPAAANVEDEVRERVLAIVSEKTGYPSDMLDPELDLEADLGIDTVKQAETFAAIRESWGIPRDENVQLRDYPTLEHAVRFVLERAEGLAAPAAAAPAAPAAVTPAATPAAAPVAANFEDEVRERVLAIVSEKTGYPSDMLDPELDLEADLGIDTVKQAETFAAIREGWDIPRDENLQLRDYPTIAHAVRFVLERSEGLAAPAAAAPATPAAATPAAAPAAAFEDEVRERVLAIVSEKTGYPSDMLDPELDLEADLGIDTVKQAETFAAIREGWDIPRDENLQLRDYPTIAHAVRFVLERAPQAGGAAPAGAAPEQSASEAPAPAATQAAPAGPPLHLMEGSLEAADTVPRRGTHAVLRPPLDLCSETGVSLGEGSRVIVMPDQGGVARALVGRLEKRGVEVLLVDRDQVSGRDDMTKCIEAWLAGGPVHGLYWLPALDVEGTPAELDLGQWRAGLLLRVKLFQAAARALFDQLGEPGRFVVSATRLGGRHGLDAEGARAPMGGAVTGFTKALGRERPEALVKAVDFPVSRKTAEFADTLVDETLRDPGAVEIGVQEGRRFTVALFEEPAADGAPGLALGGESVYVITGAAGSIVSAITADLARAASGGVFHLLDLAPAPDPGDEELTLFEGDRDGLKRRIFERLRGAGERGTPAQVETELARIERAHAASAAIRSVEGAGGSAHYHSLDLRDDEAVAKVIEEIRQSHGRIDVLLHAAGLERSRLLPDKSDDEFDLVFDVKCDGWLNLVRAIGDMPLGATVAFSSIAGRFGNGGQTDYSAANDLLSKCGSHLHGARPETRCITIDWTAWASIGMASRGSIPDLMAQAGIDMLPPEAGIPVTRRELTAGGRSGEVLIADRLGVLEEERAERGGLAAGALEENASGPMLGSVAGMGLKEGLQVLTSLDPKGQPFLDHHRIEGTAVLPGVMGLEGFAELASLWEAGAKVVELEDVDFLAPFKFYRDDAREVELYGQLEAGEGGLSARCRLLGRRSLVGQPEPQVTEHFRARVGLAAKAPRKKSEAVPGEAPATAVGSDAIYGVYFHGPAYQVLDCAWREGDGVIGRLAADLPANHSPEDAPLATLPRLLELCFQTAGVWEIGSTGRMGLPQRIDRVSWLTPGLAEPTQAFARVTPRADGRCDAVVVDGDGRVLLRMEGYGTAALPADVPEGLRAPLRDAVG